MKNQELEMQKLLVYEFQDDIKQKVNRNKELQVESQQTKRKENYLFCENLTDQLLEISELMYNHQQNIDNLEIQQDYFNEQAQLFVENKKLINQKKTRHFNIINQLKQIEKLDIEQKETLNDKEMQLYLKGKGRWTPEFKFEFEEPQKPLEENDKFQSQQPINNFYFGNLVRNVIEQYYDLKKDQLDQQDENSNKEQIDQYLAFKGCLIGYQFTGKDTLAKYLQQKYNFHILALETLVNELLFPITSQQTQPVQTVNQKTLVSNQSFKSNKSQSQRLSTQREQNQQNQLQVELTQQQKEFGQQIFELLAQGNKLTDEQYVKVIRLKLLQLFPHQEQQNFLNYYKQLEENKTKISSNLQIDEVQLQQNRFKYTNGFVLIDFPNNYNQARLLDKELGNFICQDEQKVSWKDQTLKSLNQIVQYTPDTEIERKPIKALFDQFFFIQIDCQESIRRALGRRKDNEHNTLYHLEDNIPSLDQAPLNERITKIRETLENEMVIVDKNNYFDSVIFDLQDWYNQQGQKIEQFIDLEQKESQEKPQQDENQENQEEQQKQVVIDLQPEQLEDQDRAYTGQKEDENNQNQDENKQDEQINEEVNEEQTQQQQDNNQEEEQKEEQNQNQEEEIEVQQEEQKQEQYIQTLQQIDGHQPIHQIFQQVDDNVQKILENKENQIKNLDQQIKLDQINKQKELELQKIQDENDKKWLIDDNLTEQVQIFLKNQVKDSEIIQSMYQFWQSSQDQYVFNNRVFFNYLREQRELIQVYFKGVQTKFIELLQTKDQKFYLMRQYQDEYNKFVDQQPDMIEEEDTKNELNQVVEDLHNQLFDLICKRQEFGQEEIVQQKKYNWIEQQIEQLTIDLIMQIQNEFNKAQKNIQLIRDYYQLQQPESIPEQIFDSIQTQCQDTQIEAQENKEFIYPMFEKSIQLAQKIYDGEIEVDDKNKKGAPGKKPPAGKAPGKPGQKQQEEEIKELTPLEKEGQAAINTENAIFRYNLNILKQFGLSRLKEYRTVANILFSKLETWLEYYVKIQNEAVYEMANLFRDAIENQEKIQQEITLDETEVIVSQKILNFFTPPPVILPAREDIFDNRFSISQLYQIIEEIKCLTDDNGKIDLKCFLQLINRKITNSLNIIYLPICWKDKNISDFQVLCDNLDQDKCGQIESRDLCIYLILLNSKIVNEQQEKEYKEQLLLENEDVIIDKNQFIAADCWFDKEQDNKIEENTNYFGRTKYIKELIFYVFKNEEDETINVNDYLNTLKSSKYSNKQDITYDEMLFDKDK